MLWVLRDQHHESADRVQRIVDSVEWLQDSCASYGAEEGNPRIFVCLRAVLQEQHLDAALEASWVWLKTHMQYDRSERVLERIRRADDAAVR